MLKPSEFQDYDALVDWVEEQMPWIIETQDKLKELWGPYSTSIWGLGGRTEPPYSDSLVKIVMYRPEGFVYAHWHEKAGQPVDFTETRVWIRVWPDEVLLMFPWSERGEYLPGKGR